MTFTGLSRSNNSYACVKYYQAQASILRDVQVKGIISVCNEGHSISNLAISIFQGHSLEVDTNEAIEK